MLNEEQRRTGRDESIISCSCALDLLCFAALRCAVRCSGGRSLAVSTAGRKELAKRSVSSAKLSQAGSNINMTSSPKAADGLRVAALACCNAGGDEGSVTEFVEILMAPFKILDRGREWELECDALLQQASSLLDPSSPSGKELMDLVGVELPKVVVNYTGVSNKSREIGDLLIQSLATAFDPAREMFTAFLEVINVYCEAETLHLCLPMISGLSLVFPRIRRRTAEFLKEAVPGLLALGRSSGQVEVDSWSADIRDDFSNPDRHLLLRDRPEDNIQKKVINKLINLAEVIKSICDSVQGMARLRDTLGIFTLQLLSVTCGALSDSTNAVPDGVPKLMGLLSFSKTSLSEMVCTAKVDEVFGEVFDEEEINTQRNRLEARRGAGLAVYWGLQMNEADTISGDISGLQEKFQTPGRPMVLDVIGLASNLLVPISGIQELVFEHIGLSLMTSVLEVYCTSSKDDDAIEVDDALEITIQIVPALQRLQGTIVHIPSPMLRRQAFGIEIKVISQVLPPGARFATLQSLIINSSDHPSLVSLLLTCVKDEVYKSWQKQKLCQDLNRGIVSTSSPFLSREVLEFILYGLRTKDGEIVELPTNVEAVVGALNFYLFLLILESSGNTNYTHVLSREELIKGRTYWLLPVREQILRARSGLEASGTEDTQDIQNSMDLSLHILLRCLGMVEQQLEKLPNQPTN